MIKRILGKKIYLSFQSSDLAFSSSGSGGFSFVQAALEFLALGGQVAAQFVQVVGVSLGPA